VGKRAIDLIARFADLLDEELRFGFTDHFDLGLFVAGRTTKR